MADQEAIELYNGIAWLLESKMPRLTVCLGDPFDEFSLPQYREWEDGSWYSAIEQPSGPIRMRQEMEVERHYGGPLFDAKG